MAAPTTAPDSYSVDAGAVLTVGYPQASPGGGGGGGGNPPQGTQTPEGVTIQTWSIENTSGVTQSAFYASHALPCAQGDYAAGKYPLAVIGGTETDTQCNVLATWPDGSIKHCMVHYNLGSMSDGQTKSVVFDRTSVQPVGANVDINAQTYNYARVSVNLTENTTSFYGLNTDSNNVTITQRYTGSICQEIIYSGFLTTNTGLPHPHLRGFMHVRQYANGYRSVDYVVENSTSWVSSPQQYATDSVDAIRTYIERDDGSNKFVPASLTETFLGDTIPVRTRHYLGRMNNSADASKDYSFCPHPDSAYLKANAFVPNYVAATVAESSISSQHTSYLSNDEIGNIGLARGHMGGTGAAPDIGILPEWQARYIQTPDSRLFDDMVGTSHRAGSWRIHYRDETNNGVPMRLSDWPLVSNNWYSQPSLPAVGANGSGAFDLDNDGEADYQHDIAHQPSFSYLPYLITGDLYHLEEMQFWASYNGFNLDAQNGRNALGSGSDGVFTKSQQRGMAWGLRTLEQCAFITPDTDPFKANIQNQLDKNIEWLLRARVEDFSFSPLGDIRTVLHKNEVPAIDVSDSIRPWMSDFWGMVWTDIKARHSHDGRVNKIAKWCSRWQQRAVLPEFCQSDAPEYSYVVKPGGGSQPWFTSFHEILEQEHPTHIGSCPTVLDQGNPALSDSYMAQLYAALSNGVELGRAGALTAKNNYLSVLQANNAPLTNSPHFYINHRSVGSAHPLDNLPLGQWVTGRTLFSNWWDDVYVPIPSGNQSIDGLFRYSAGAFDPSNNRYIHFGGGHNDSANNQVLAMDFDTMSIVALTQPSTGVISGSRSTSDGAKSSAHTYSGCSVLGSPYNLFFAAGSSPWPNGGGYAGLFSLSLDDYTWSSELNSPNTPGFGGLMCTNPRTNQLYIVNDSGLSRYNPDTGLHDFKGSYYNGFDGYSCMDYNPWTDKIFIYGGTGDRTGLGRGHVIDLSNGLANATDAAGSWTGDTAIFNATKGGTFFHPRLRKFLAYNQTISQTNVYAIDETAETVQSISIAGVTPHAPGGGVGGGNYPNYGVWKRFFYIPEYDVVAFIPDSTEIYFMRLNYASI